ncbi:MAG: hypothetical protein JNN01_08210 [Opitutaceae bacterium]|nr:hypothetical protein [Opitutaceae bacterium]
MSRERSRRITDMIDRGDKTDKPGWVRISLHPTMTDEEAYRLLDAIEALAAHHLHWASDYRYDRQSNEFVHVRDSGAIARRVHQWFDEFGETGVLATTWEPMGLGYEI